MPRYEWDEEKRFANLKKHKLDFRVARYVYEHPDKVTVADQYPYEERFWDLAEVNGAVRLLVYTMRGSVVRCISFRPTTPSERRFYYEEIKNR
jgi:uncharacterized DUF497 family protein